MNTRYNTDLHFTTAKLTAFQRGVYFVGIKLFNHLPTNIKRLSNETEFLKLKPFGILLKVKQVEKQKKKEYH
jgi:hypothetical protein